MSQFQNIVALIPARAGSKRIQNKNIRVFLDHPLIAYTIETALQSKIFSSIIVSTDSLQIANVAKHYGACVPFLRPKEYASDLSPDIDWLEYTLRSLEKLGEHFDYFSILRPTSPFRKPDTICRAWSEFVQHEDVESLRAVEKCKQHPYKMWTIENQRLRSLFVSPDSIPWHSRPYQQLPEIFVQNASLEIAKTSVVFEKHSISGDHILPFLTKDLEGFDINDEMDWEQAVRLASADRQLLVMPLSK